MSISTPLRLALLVGSLCAIAAFCLLLASMPAKIGESDSPIAAPRHQGAWAVPVDKSFNLYQMTPTLYRSALPTTENLALLEKLQIHTVLSFIKDDDSVWLGAAGVNRISIPLHADKVDDADVLRVLRTLHDAEAKGPVLMHCKHGRDRTGIMAAMYRSVIQGWSKEDALNEMQQGGYGSLEDVADATRYVEGADLAKLRSAFASGECSTTRFSTCYVRNWRISE